MDVENSIFDLKYCDELSKIIRSSPIFSEEKDVNKYYNILLVAVDRISDSINYINENHLEKHEDFIIFLTFACMLRDAVIKLIKQLGIYYKYENINDPDSYKYFNKIFAKYKCLHNKQMKRETNINCMSLDCLTSKCPIYENEKLDDCPTDDKFFEYIRSLVFAHPFETDRAKFLEKNEIQYSPWVVVEKNYNSSFNNIVNLRIFSNKFDGLIDLDFSLNTIIDYINSRYELLTYIIEWAKNKIIEYKKLWARRKVNRSLPPVEILKDIRSILVERHEEHYDIDDAIRYLECELTEPSNLKAVTKYKENLIKEIMLLCDNIDAVERNNYLTDSFISALDPRPSKFYEEATYQLEKIFSYLNKEAFINRPDNVEWGIKQAMNFYNSFAKDYVIIKPNMPFIEIKLLVNTACYLEKLNQENGIINANLAQLILEDEKQRERINNLQTIKTIQIGDIIVNIKDLSGNPLDEKDE